jgi:PAS domain S-box-containing protein
MQTGEHPSLLRGWLSEQGESWVLTEPSGATAPVQDWLDPASVSAFLEALEQPFATMEARCRRADGWRWYRLHLTRGAQGVELLGMDTEAEHALAAQNAMIHAATRVGAWEFQIHPPELRWSEEVWHLHDMEPHTGPVSLDDARAMYAPHSRELIAEAYRRCLLNGQNCTLDVEAQTPQGRRVFLHVTAEVVQEGGVPVRLRGSVQDVTSRQEVEAALRESEERLQMALSASDLSFWEWNIPTDQAMQDLSWLRKVGWEGDTPVQGIIHEILSRTFPEDRPRFSRALTEHLEGRSPNFDVEYRLVIDEEAGEWVWLQSRGKVVEWDAEGRPLRMTGTVQDISLLKKVRDALEDMEGRWRTLVMTSPDSILLTDTKGFIAFVNRQDLLSQSVGKHVADFVAPSSRNTVHKAIQRVLTGEPFVEYETETTFSGRTSFWLVRLVRVGDQLMFVSRDITERLEVDRALRESEARHRTVLEAAPDGIITADGKGRILSFNQAAERMFGFRREQAVSMTLSHLLPDVPAGVLLSGAGPLFGRRADGTRFPVELSAAEARVDQDLLHTVVVKDATERQHEKARLMLTDRLASLGMLSASVVHELSSPLTAILTNIGFLQGQALLNRLGADPRGEEQALEECATAGGQIRALLQDLRLFSRMDAPVGATSDLARVVNWVSRILRLEVQRKGRLIVKVEPVPAVVGADLRLGQVFTNLVVNAVQALPVDRREQNEIRIRVYRRDADQVCVEVVDNGQGIPKEMLSRIFEPFFTTKPVGEGTGLGLSICQDLVRACGGSIEVESELGKGSTFRVLLPVALGNLPVELPVLLVVDPDPGISKALQRGLEGRLRVVAEHDGREALRKIKGGNSFAGVLYDLGTPGLGAQVFLEALSHLAPALAARCLFSASAWDAEARLLADRVGAERILEKPYDVQNLPNRLQ